VGPVFQPVGDRSENLFPQSVQPSVNMEDAARSCADIPYRLDCEPQVGNEREATLSGRLLEYPTMTVLSAWLGFPYSFRNDIGAYDEPITPTSARAVSSAYQP
jgi:hypothetical protein